MITTKEKIELIKKIAGDNDISPYQIGQETSISVSSASKIFSGEQPNPRNRTLNIILDYLETAIIGTKGQLELTDYAKGELKAVRKVAEPYTEYKTEFNSLSIEEKLNQVYIQNLTITAKLDQISEIILHGLIENDDRVEKKQKQQSNS